MYTSKANVSPGLNVLKSVTSDLKKALRCGSLDLKLDSLNDSLSKSDLLELKKWLLEFIPLIQKKYPDCLAEFVGHIGRLARAHSRENTTPSAVVSIAIEFCGFLGHPIQSNAVPENFKGVFNMDREATILESIVATKFNYDSATKAAQLTTYINSMRTEVGKLRDSWKTEVPPSDNVTLEEFKKALATVIEICKKDLMIEKDVYHSLIGKLPIVDRDPRLQGCYELQMAGMAIKAYEDADPEGSRLLQSLEDALGVLKRTSPELVWNMVKDEDLRGEVVTLVGKLSAADRAVRNGTEEDYITKNKYNGCDNSVRVWKLQAETLGTRILGVSGPSDVERGGHKVLVAEVARSLVRNALGYGLNI